MLTLDTATTAGSYSLTVTGTSGSRADTFTFTVNVATDAAPIISTTSFSLAENTNNPIVLTATEANNDDVLFTLQSGMDAGRFTLADGGAGANTATLTFQDVPDFEDPQDDGGNNIYQVSVQASSMTGTRAARTTTETITITVTPVDEHLPVLAPKTSPLTSIEGETAPLQTFTLTDADAGEAQSFALSGTDQGLFALNPTTGVLRLDTTTTAGSYSLTVTGTSGSRADSFPLIVNVAGDAAPIISTTSFSLAENTNNPITLTATEANNDDVVFTLQSGMDAGRFTFADGGAGADTATLTFNAAPDFEDPQDDGGNNIYQVSVQASSMTGTRAARTTTETITITVTGVDEFAPVLAPKTSPLTSIEGETAPLQTFTLVDADDGEAQAFALSGTDVSSFELNPITGVLTLDATTGAGNYDLTVTGTSGSRADAFTFTVNVAADAAPIISTTSFNLAENTNNPITLTATEANNDDVMFTLQSGMDAEHFTFADGGAGANTATLTFNAVPDFEAPLDEGGNNIYQLSVQASSTTGARAARTTTETITITVTPVDEFAPVLAPKTSPLTSIEGETAPLQTFTLTDADDGEAQAFALSGADVNLFTLNTTTGALTLAATTAAGSYSLTVTGTSGSRADSFTFTVDVAGDAAPIISTTSFSLAENTNNPITLAATEANNDDVMFTLQSGPDDGRFTFADGGAGTNTATLTFQDVPDFENPLDEGGNNIYQVSVQASSTTGARAARTTTETITITVTPVDEFAPVLAPKTSPLTTTEGETAPIQTFTLVDADDGEVQSFALSGADVSSFELDTASGVLRLDTATTAGNYDLIVTGTSGGRADAFTLIVNVAGDAAPIISTTSFSLAENTNNPITLTATEANNDDVMFTLQSGMDAEHFTFADGGAGANTATLTFNAAPDFENPLDEGGNNIYQVSVQASSITGGRAARTTTETITITVTGVDEHLPTLAVTPGPYNLAENSTAVIATLTSADQDRGDTVSLITSGADEALFDLNAATGALTFAAAPDFENPRGAARTTTNTNTYNLSVQATSTPGSGTDPNERRSAALDLVITVTPVDEFAPVLAPKTSPLTTTEGETAPLQTFTLTDADAGEAQAFALSGADVSSFELNPTSGALRLAAATGAGSYSLTVTGTSGSRADAFTFTVDVMSDNPAVFAVTAFELPEDRNPPQVMLSATDADGATVTLTLTSVRDGALFSLEDSLSTGGTTMANLRFLDQPDFEAPADTAASGFDAAGNNIYLVRVRANSMDLNGESVRTTENITITVTPVDEFAPVLAPKTSPLTTTEGEMAPLQTFTLVDADDGEAQSFALSGADVSSFELNPITGALRLAATTTAGNYDLIVTGTSGSRSDTFPLTVNVATDAAPIISTTSFSLAENTNNPITLTATEANNDDVMFTLQSGMDAEHFTFADGGAGANTATLTFQDVPDFEVPLDDGGNNIYQVSVQASSMTATRAARTTTETISITVTPVDEDAPVLAPRTSPLTTTEGTTAPIQTFSLVDADAGEVQAFALSGTDISSFELNPTSGALTLATTTTAGSYNLTITGTSGSRSDTFPLTVNVAGDAAPIISTTSFSLAENTNNPITLTATEANNDDVVFALQGGPDDGHFTFADGGAGTNTATLTFQDAPDFENPLDEGGNNIYQVSVQASSTTGGRAARTTTETITITVTPVDEDAPVLAPRTSPLTTTEGETTVLQTFTLVDADDGEVQAFALSGTGASSFELNTTTGVLTLAATTTAGSYSLTITGTSGGRADSFPLIVNVAGDAAPIISTTSFSLAENTNNPITLTATEANNDDVMFTLQGGPDDGRFTFADGGAGTNTATLTFQDVPDFENPLDEGGNNIYELSVQASSITGARAARTTTETITIRITPVDEFAPVLAPKTSPLTSIEGETAPLQTFTLTDADAGEAQAFALSGADVSSFELDTATGVLRLAATTTAGSYSLTVTGTSGSRADAFTLTVDVAADAAPIIGTTSFSLAENTNNPITLTATEANNDDVLFTLQSGMDAGRFTLADGGAGANTATLTFQDVPDFEDPQDEGGNNIYQLSVQASSTTGGRAARTTTETIRIEVTPVDESAPVLTPKTSPLTTTEGEMAVLQTFILTDADDGEAQSFALSGADVSSFELGTTSGVLRLPVTTGAGSYDLTVTGTSGSRADAFTFTVNVAADAAPIISTTSFSLAENTNNPIVLAATEANNDDVLFTLQSGMDAEHFTLADGGAGADTAALTFQDVPDFEDPQDDGGNNIYQVSVQASSTTGGRAARTTTETITITVTGVDEDAPVLTPKTSPLTSIEGETAPLQTFTLTDADDGEAQSFALSGADVSSFELNPTSGALRLDTATTAGSYSLTITGTSGSQADTFTFTVDVATDAAPVFVETSFSLAENTNNPITLTATEANNDDVMFTLQSGMDAERFTFADGGAGANTATLTFQDVPDFENPLDEGGNNIYQVSVQASSITGARAARTTTETIRIEVTPVDEDAPVLTPKTSPLTTTEGEAAVLQTFTLTDADDGEAQSFALSGADVSSFELNPTSGVLTLAATTAAGSYSLTVTGTSGSRADTFPLIVNVATDAAPAFVETSFNLAENTNNPITLTATEANNDDVVFALQGGPDDGRFNFADGGAGTNTATLTFQDAPDFENPLDEGGNNIYQVSVQASSMTGTRAARTTTETITITVTPVDEFAPVLTPKTSPLTSIEGETAPIQTFTLTDADAGEVQSFALSGTGANSFELDSTTGVLRLAATTTAGSYSLTVSGASAGRADSFPLIVNVAGDAAPIISTTSFSLAENTNNPITLTATEANNDDVMFTLQSGMDAERFTFADGGAGANTATLTFNAVPDFEAPLDDGGNNIYQLSVQASSMTATRAARTTTETITITVTPVDEDAPVLAPRTSLLTSIEGETAVLQTFTLVDADDGEAQSFALSGADVSSFELNTTTGVLTLPTTTTAGSYSLTITGTSGSRADTFPLTVNVAGDAAPIISTTSFSLAENTNNPITLTATEANNDDVMFTLQGGMDAGRFNFADGGAGDNTATLTFNAVPDFEDPQDEGGNNIYELSVQASSTTGARAARTTTETITITVTPVDEFAPVLVPKTSPLTTVAGETAVLQTFTLTDADDGEVQAFALSGTDISSFELNPTSGVFRLATTTTAGSYSLTITGTSGGRADSFPLIVNVADDAAPIIGTTSFSLAENTNNPITLTATEANNDDVMFTLQGGMDDGRFNFADGGAGTNTATLTFNTVPDFENPQDDGGNNIYELSVQASSITGGRAARTTTETITITVTPVDEDAPVLAPRTSPLTTTEGEAAVLQTFTLVDADDGEAQSFALSGTDVSSFELNPITGALTLAATTTAGSYSLTVTGTSGSRVDAFTFTVNVAGDAAPIISTTSFSLAENTNNPIVLAATEANNDDVLFTLQSGLDAGRFTLADGGASADTATLTFNAAPDFEVPLDEGGNNIYELSVQASSMTGTRAARTTTETIRIEVTPVDEDAPVLAPKTSPLTTTEGETAPLQTFTLVDADDGEAQSFALSGADVSSFELNPTSGALRLDTATTAGSYSLTVTGTSGSRADSFTFTVNVMSDNPAVFADTEFDLPEDRNPPQVMLSATDADGATVTLTLMNVRDGALFTLEDSLSTGGTTMANLRFIAQPDFENPRDTATPAGDNIYLVRVLASSMDLNGVVVRTTENISIRVTGVDEHLPTLAVTPGPYNLAENSTVVIATLTAADQDDGDVVRLSTSGTDAALFDLDAATGALTFVSAPDFENPRGVPFATANTNTYNLLVQAISTSTPGSGTPPNERRSITSILTIRVTPVDEDAPVLAPKTSPLTRVEGTTGALQTFSLTDADAGEVQAFALSGADVSSFELNATTGALRLAAATGAGSYSLTVTGTSGSRADAFALTVNVATDAAPAFVETSFSVAENTNNPIVLTATDANNDDVLFTLQDTPDAPRFTFADGGAGDNTATLTFNAVPDFEVPLDDGRNNIYELSVQASSMAATRAPRTITETIRIAVTGVDDNDPVLTTTQATYEVPENSTETIVTLQATDVEGDTLRFEIADGAGNSPDRAHFTLDASTGVLRFASPQDFEAPNDANTDHTYQITVRATSTSGSGTGSPSRTSNPLALAIRLTAIDEADPTITPTQATYTFRTGATGTIATFTIEDSDAGETRTFGALEAAPGSGTNLTAFHFNTGSGVLSFQGPAAAATSALIITATSNAKAALLAITLTVDGTDAPPAFVKTTFSQAENATPTLTLTATEADGDDVSFALQSGRDATYFALTDGGAAANTATLIFRNAPNFESPQGATLLPGDHGKNTYQMNVRAASTTSPNTEQTMTQLITINVTDADDPPTFTTARDALMIMEGETATTAMLEVIDQDDDPVTLALTGGADQNQFTLTTTGTALSFISAPDFEAPADTDTNNIYEVEITASSTGPATGATTLSAVRTFNITVTDADDNAPELTSPTTFQIQSGETAVATLEATDADAGDTETIVFALSGGADQSQFALTNAGVLSFTSAADFTEPTDADGDNIYAIEITLTSGSRPHTTQAALEIEVINIDHQSRQRIGNVILAHIARSLADNTQDIIFARTSGRLTNNLTLSNRQGDLDDLIKGIQGFSFMRKFDAKKAAAASDAIGTTTQTKERGFALWAKGHIRTFSASPSETAINNFSGHIYNLNLGADYQTGALLFGGLVTASQSSVKFTSGSTEGQGRIRTKLTTFAPYVHLRFQSGTEIWGSAGFGQGRMRYQSETTGGGFERTDLKYAQFAGGLYQPLKALQKTNLALRLDGYTARLKAEAREDVFLAMTGDVSRVRGLLEVGYRRQGAEKGVLDAKLNGGARLERGDIGKGVGLEFGAEITYANPASGLSVSADINAILLHTAQKYRHLDAGLRFLLGPGIKKRGLQLRLEPRIGGGATPVAPLWDGAPVGGSDSPAGQLGTSGLGQLQTALGLSYSFAARQSLLTPFTEMRLDDRGAPIDLMLGMRFSRADLPINITLYTQKALGTTGVHLRLNWR